MGFARNGDFQPVHILGQINLTGQAAGRFNTGGKVEHIFLILGSLRDFEKPILGQYHMAGGTGHLPLAGPLQRHSGILADSKQVLAGRGLGFNFFAIAGDEGDFDGDYS